MAAIMRFTCDRCGFVDHSATLPNGWLNIGDLGLHTTKKSVMLDVTAHKHIQHICMSCKDKLVQFLSGWNLA